MPEHKPGASARLRLRAGAFGRRFGASLRRTVPTLAAGAVGGFAFDWIDLPAAWLGGAAIAVAAASLAGLRAHVPLGLRAVVFCVLGVSMGTGITPETVHRVREWPISLALLPIVVAGVVWGSYVFLRGVARWDRATAFYASIPGALSYVMAVAVQSPADIKRVATSQSIRLLTLVAVLPLLVGGPAAEAAVDLVFPTAHAGLRDVAILIGCGAVAGLAFGRLGVPAGMLTGAFLASALLHGTGAVPALPLPMWLLVPGFVCLGALTGSRIGGIGFRAFAGLAVVSCGALVVGLAVSLAGAMAVVAATSATMAQALLAFAPGGIDAMTALAMLLGADPAFVATHQLVRLVLLLVCVPVAIRIAGVGAGR